MTKRTLAPRSLFFFLALGLLFLPARGEAADAKTIVGGGGSHACAVTTGGGLKCWGANWAGQLGDATMTDRLTPRDVSGLASGVAAAAAGNGYTCAVTTGGAVKCWGWNYDGQLGDGTTTMRATPTPVSGLASGVALVGAGYSHTCAVTTGGGVKCWGQNGNGQLGDGTTTTRSTPADVPGLTSGVSSIALGADHVCALTTGGGVMCWGANAYGQLGDGSTTRQVTPVSVATLTTGVAAVTAGQWHTCALTTGGAVKCWGYNALGQLGDATYANRSTPVSVSTLASGAAAASAGAFHTCALTSAGAVKCWGNNAYGQLGDGTTTGRSTPAVVSGLASGLVSLAAGANHACAITAGGGVKCWGQNYHGELGNATRAVRTTPVAVPGLAGGVSAADGGDRHSCALTTTGGVKCWGNNDMHQLGDGTTAARSTPTGVSGLASGVLALSSGVLHTCAVTTGGAVTCWGNNADGQLGDGTNNTTRTTPVSASGLTSGVSAVAAGAYHSCALTAGGGVKCWGYNGNGALGDGTTTSRWTPTSVSGLGSGVVAIASGSYHMCALTSAGGVKCWGFNSSGQLGDGSTTTRTTPTDVSGLTSGVAAIAEGATHACAITTTGGLKCWGANSGGQLGDGTGINRLTPTDVTGLTSGVASAAAASSHTCALTTGGGVKCWGSNGVGQLGDGTTVNHLTPGDVSALTGGVASVAAGWNQTCAVTSGGALLCWGIDEFGQIGDLSEPPAFAPVKTVGLGHADFDADDIADIAVYRPSTGTWFSVDSSAGNTAMRYHGWGVNAQGDTPVLGDFDGDGVLDPTVFRPGTGTWFILLSKAGFTTWTWFGWGSSGDTLVPGDYDGDGKTDAAVYRASTGTWYVKPSSGATQWNLAFGNATDQPIAGDFDGDGRRDLAVYRASTGTWFWLTSSSNYTGLQYKGWGVNAQGDTPAPGDYDGDGKTDLCVFRPGTGTWYVLQSSSGFASMSFFGWGTTGDTVAPGDYDGDGITDGAVYRPSNYTWYIRPSSGATQWSKIFGQSGDLPLVTIR